ncbi:MAG: Trk system potassium transporter TrkA [Alphaproteobacteria bacterium]
MKIIVLGAGQVGSSIARYLASEGNDVTVVDQSANLIRALQGTLDVKALVGHASNPDILEGAGAADADMVVAVTYSDEVNMVACQVAHSLFKVPKKIARVREQSYLKKEWSDLFSGENMAIDAIISPEIEVARAVIRQLEMPGARESITMADGRVRVIGVRCTEETPVIRTPLRQLSGIFPDMKIIVVGILRGGATIVPMPDDQMQPGDEVYFAVDAKHVDRAMTAFGHEEREAHRLIIVGGGNIGFFLAREIEEHHRSVNAKVIEIDPARADFAARRLKRIVVLCADALDAEALKEANIASAETLVAVTNDDETNILTSLLAKRSGCNRVITLINKPSYAPLVTDLGVDVVVSPRGLTVSTILQHVRRGRVRAVRPIGDGFAEIIETEVMETSTLVGQSLRDSNLPDGMIIGAVVRGDQVILPRGDTVLEAHDRVIMLVRPEAMRRVERFFSVRLEYF